MTILQNFKLSSKSVNECFLFSGFMRRSTVYKNLHNFKKAAEDLKKVLHIEPENAIAKVSI